MANLMLSRFRLYVSDNFFHYSWFLFGGEGSLYCSDLRVLFVFGLAVDILFSTPGHRHHNLYIIILKNGICSCFTLFCSGSCCVLLIIFSIVSPFLSITCNVNLFLVGMNV